MSDETKSVRLSLHGRTLRLEGAIILSYGNPGFIVELDDDAHFESIGLNVLGMTNRWRDSVGMWLIRLGKKKMHIDNWNTEAPHD
jgi:hypothetical protein